MISTNSPVMTACRVLLYRIVNLSIMSPAFFDALSMAFRRAEISQAWPSARAQKRLLAKAYSRMLARTSSSISKAVKLAIPCNQQGLRKSMVCDDTHVTL